MADVASAEFRIALRPASLLLPNDGTKPPPHPLVKASKRGRCFAETEVAVPSIEVDGEVFDSTFEAHAPCAACQFPNPPLEPGRPSTRDSPLRLFTGCEAEAQECTLPRRADALFAVLILSLSLVSRNRVTPSITRRPARWLPTRCCSHRHNARSRWPRCSSSRSSSLSTRLDNNGDSGPPCGVPSSVVSTSPFSITPRSDSRG